MNDIQPQDRGHVTDHNIIDRRLDDLEAMPPGTSDPAVAGFIGDPASDTATALSATIVAVGDEIFAPPTSAFQDLLAKINAGVSNLSILVITDSTGQLADPPTWLRQLPAAMSAKFPTLTVVFKLWEEGTTGSYGTVSTTAGSGTQTLTIWGAASAGKKLEYFTDYTRIAAMYEGVNPDLTIVSLGHNDNSPGIAAGSATTLEGARSKYVSHVEQMRLFAGGTGAMVLFSQNPLLEQVTASERRADIYRRIAIERGYGFVDIAQAFHDDGRPLTDLVQTVDGVHPTAAGYTIWLNTVMAQLNWQPYSQVIPNQPPSFAQIGSSAVPNAYFATFDGSTAPSGWLLTNITPSKDTTNYETGSWGLKLTQTAANTVSYLICTVPLTLVRSRTLTVAFRVFIPTGQDDNVGQAQILASSGSSASQVWSSKGQFIWRTATYYVPQGASIVRIRLYLDVVGNLPVGASCTVDRVSLSFDAYPKETP